MLDALPFWEPALPRRAPRLWPTISGLLVTFLMVTGGVVTVLIGLRAPYAQPADRCSAIDVSPVAALVRQPVPEVSQNRFGDQCGALLGDTESAGALGAEVWLGITVYDNDAKARLDHLVNGDSEAPGTGQALPGGLRGKLVVRTVPSDLPGVQTCRYQASVIDVNATVAVIMQLVRKPPGPACDADDDGARALAASVRASLDRLR